MLEAGRMLMFVHVARWQPVDLALGVHQRGVRACPPGSTFQRHWTVAAHHELSAILLPFVAAAHAAAGRLPDAARPAQAFLGVIRLALARAPPVHTDSILAVAGGVRAEMAGDALAEGSGFVARCLIWWREAGVREACALQPVTGTGRVLAGGSGRERRRGGWGAHEEGMLHEAVGTGAGCGEGEQAVAQEAGGVGGQGRKEGGRVTKLGHLEYVGRIQPVFAPRAEDGGAGAHLQYEAAERPDVRLRID
mmetsp:Transcript_37768/g.100306  ORF Transcript_37768/g.100306 Transcript_37768/m.100306 type:complete len:250 (-) Transcript_37768:143-892(-)